VGILPVGETSYAVRNNFDNGVLLAQGELQHEDTLLAAGFWSEEFWVVN
jgi:glycine/D-amino acid oxidase-like deaminating enzyme